MFESGEELFHVQWHGYVHVTLLVVPFEGDSAVECTVPILFEFVVCAEGVDEVVGVVLPFEVNNNTTKAPVLDIMECGG